jgi:hypothetical protein
MHEIYTHPLLGLNCPSDEQKLTVYWVSEDMIDRCKAVASTSMNWCGECWRWVVNL